jgi:hypothetical protein
MGRPKKGGGAKVTEKSSVSPDLEMAAVLDTPQVKHIFLSLFFKSSKFCLDIRIHELKALIVNESKLSVLDHM